MSLHGIFLDSLRCSAGLRIVDIPTFGLSDKIYVVYWVVLCALSVELLIHKDRWNADIVV